ncbi:MAG: Spx/MgsR family RNA polymerase-binding regulatory protein [Parvibaculum sp.]
MIRVNGLKSCDTCKKALKWLEAEGIAFTYRDVRADGILLADLKAWGAKVGFETLVNKASTTWRGLSDQEKAAAQGAGAAQLLAENPTLIKRPVFECEDRLWVGFKADVQAALKSL